MKKGIRIAAMIAIVVFASTLSGVAEQAPTAAKEGYLFLERLVGLVVKAAAPGSANPDIASEIVGLAKEFKAAHAAKRVDDLFAVRYLRILSAVRQAILMDPEVLLWPMYRRTMIDFIEERTGKIPEWKDLLFIVNDHGGAGIGLGMIAEAVISEVVSLHLYLETLDQRPDITKKYIEKAMK